MNSEINENNWRDDSTFQLYRDKYAALVEAATAFTEVGLTIVAYKASSEAVREDGTPDQNRLTVILAEGTSFVRNDSVRALQEAVANCVNEALEDLTRLTRSLVDTAAAPEPLPEPTEDEVEGFLAEVDAFVAEAADSDGDA